VLKNVHIQAQHGMPVSNADVSGENFSVQAADGSGIIKAAGGNITLR
jgi:hypothetical protein